MGDFSVKMESFQIMSTDAISTRTCPHYKVGNHHHWAPNLFMYLYAYIYKYIKYKYHKFHVMFTRHTLVSLAVRVSSTICRITLIAGPEDGTSEVLGPSTSNFNLGACLRQTRPCKCVDRPHLALMCPRARIPCYQVQSQTHLP